MDYMSNELSEKIFLSDIKNYLKTKDNKICFILGAGASANSGIMTGAAMAKQWYSELDTAHKPDVIQKWKNEVNFDEKNISEFYSQLFSFRYSRDQLAGVQFINDEIEQGKYSIGHIILAQILTSTHNNVVITTNFDTLIEEAIYNTTFKRPLVCSHEAVAIYATAKSERPLIIKIHRDRFMDPMNNESDTNLMKFEWAEPLNKIFENYLPIVIGYGGNDGSVMNYLASTKKIKRLYWCKRENSFIGRKNIGVLRNTNGYLVNIKGFDDLMFALKDVFNLVPTAGFVSENIDRKNKKIIEQINLLQNEKEDQDFKEYKDQAIRPVDKDNYLYWLALIEDECNKDGATNDDIISIYNEALNNLPNNYILHYNLGMTFMNVEVFDKAEWHFKKTIILNPLFAEVYYNLGVLYIGRGEQNKAIEYYKDAVRIDPNLSNAWYNLGNIYSEIDDNVLAIEAYKNAYEIGKDYKAASNLGFVLKKIGRLIDALYYFNKALEIEPNDYLTMNNLGITYLQLGNGREVEAIKFLTKALEINSRYYASFLNLGHVYKKLGDYPRAAFYYGKVLEIVPFYQAAIDALDEIKDRL